MRADEFRGEPWGGRPYVCAAAFAMALASDQQVEAARQEYAEAKEAGFTTTQLSAGDRQRLKKLEAIISQ